MAQRKKRVTVGKRKSAARGKTRKSSGSVKTAERTATKSSSKKVVAKAKRHKGKKLTRRKATPMNPLVTPVIETTIVDVVEEPVPGVITVTEFVETDIRDAGAGEERREESRGA